MKIKTHLTASSVALVLLSLFASAAQAHIEMGTYAGKMSDGAACSMVTVKKYYEGGKAHPLNERVTIRVGADEYTAVHPPILDVTTFSATFNHDAFQAMVALPTGARALWVEISHIPGQDGPRAFYVIEHNWKTSARTVIHCQNLQFTP